MRKKLFPSLIRAYESWYKQGDWEPLMTTAQAGREHWQRLAMGLLRLYSEQPDRARVEIMSLLEANPL